MDNPYSIIDMILRKKDVSEIESYSGDAEALPPFIVCKLLSRNSGCHQEALVNILGLISMCPIDKTNIYTFLSKVTPKVKDARCLKW